MQSKWNGPSLFIIFSFKISVCFEYLLFIKQKKSIENLVSAMRFNRFLLGSSGIPSDPTNGAYIDELGDVPINIAYAGSCTAGKDDDFAYYAMVTKAALDAGLQVADGVDCYIQFGSMSVKNLSMKMGWTEVFERAGVKLIDPGCGACIGAGPGVSENDEQVTVSAINRNFQGRSGPGLLYLASPLTVMTSAFTGKITAWHPEIFNENS